MFILKEDVPFGVKMLWASVVRRAIFDYVLYKGVGSQSMLWKRAFQYLFVDELEYDNSLSFEQVCSLFNWDHNYLRRLIIKLTRSDIRRMENDKVREEFVDDPSLEYLKDIQNMISEMVRNASTWEKFNFAVPFLPPSNHSKTYEEEMTPKLVRKESYLRTSAPMVEWQAATV